MMETHNAMKRGGYALVRPDEREHNLLALVPVLITLYALLLWFLSLGDIDLSRMSGLGLISVLPLSFSIALGILIASFCLALHWRQLSTPVLLLHYVALILMLYGTTILVAEVPHGHVPWRHAGFAEYLMRGGKLDGRLEFYFNFPGFFAISALLSSLAGFQNPILFVAWAPLFFNLLYLGPLFVILRSGTDDRRLVALGIWFFYLANWVGQDFFVPQALNFFFYLVILSILLKWFKTQGGSPPEISAVWRSAVRRFPILLRVSERFIVTDGTNTPGQPWQRAGLIITIVVLILVTVASHPLTPWFLLLSVTALTVFSQVTPRSLPILIAIMIAAWLSFMAVAYLTSVHADSVFGEVGNITRSLDENLTNRVRGSPEHLFIVYMRLATTAVIWGLAFLGNVRSFREGRWYPAYLLLAGVPFLLLVLQPYGGEMLLRAYLFSLPAIAFFAAALFYTTPKTNTSLPATILIFLISVALLDGFLFARFGDEKLDNFTFSEFAAVRQLYETAEPGSLMVTVSRNLPWKFQDYEKFNYRTMTREARTGDINAFISLMENDKFPASYLILSYNQKVFVDSYLGWEPGTWDSFEQALLDSNRFELVFSNEDAHIYRLVDQETETGTIQPGGNEE